MHSQRQAALVEVKCDFCGYVFDPAATRAGCGSCPLASRCGKVKCPNCGFELAVLPPNTWWRHLRTWLKERIRG